MTRREFNNTVLLAGSGILSGCAHLPEDREDVRIATFTSDVTPPPGHALMGGGIEPAREVRGRLTARGFVLMPGSQRPIVFVALDWCELRNGSYLQWKQVLATAVGTTPERVFVTSIHVHDAPVVDAEAQKLLMKAGAASSICDIAFQDSALSQAAAALKRALESARPLTSIGFGKAAVQKIASNRRFVRPNGEVSFGRGSSTKDPDAASAPEGTIDPFLRMCSFWSGDSVVATLSVYATHPMSTYGRGLVSPDFVGDARERMAGIVPDCLHIYASGCSGNVTAGKFNDGAPERRGELASRLLAAMSEAWQGTNRTRSQAPKLSATEFVLEPRRDGHFARAALERRLKEGPKPFDQCLAALGLSWADRVGAGVPLSLQAVDFGAFILLLLPAESYVEYQLFAQRMRPDVPVICCGYGECGPGYIPTETAWREQDTNLNEWCWVAPGAESRLNEAIQKTLKETHGA